MLCNILLLLVANLTFSAGNLAPKLQNREGITGYVRVFKGNQMPMLGQAQSAGSGRRCQVYVFSAVPVSKASGTSPLFSNINGRLIAIVKTDSTGHYIVHVPPGKYSLFIKQGKGFFSNEIDDGYLTPVDVRANKLAVKNINVTLQSTF